MSSIRSNWYLMDNWYDYKTDSHLRLHHAKQGQTRVTSWMYDLNHIGWRPLFSYFIKVTRILKLIYFLLDCVMENWPEEQWLWCTVCKHWFSYHWAIVLTAFRLCYNRIQFRSIHVRILLVFVLLMKFKTMALKKILMRKHSFFKSRIK